MRKKHSKMEFICKKNCRICPSPGAICNRNDSQTTTEADKRRMSVLLKDKANTSKEGDS